MDLDKTHNIWRMPRYLPYLQPPLTDEILKNAEIQIGFKLPKELIEILKIQNGGYIRYELGETPQTRINGIGPYYPSLNNFDWGESIECVSFELDGLVPFDGDGHWYICLDYRENKETPKITLVDIECNNQEEIADSFEEYIKLLELDTKNILAIETESTIEETKGQLENILHIQFDEPDYFAHGYPIYRSKYKDKWIWLTPNKVLASFIREGENRYDELKEQMNFFSLRYPELNENQFFIEVLEEKLISEIIKKLRENKITINLITDLI